MKKIEITTHKRCVVCIIASRLVGIMLLLQSMVSPLWQLGLTAQAVDASAAKKEMTLGTSGVSVIDTETPNDSDVVMLGDYNAKNNVRPAFTLDQNAILFTSDAMGGVKSGAVSNTLAAVQSTAPTAWKLTVKYDAHTLSTAVATTSFSDNGDNATNLSSGMMCTSVTVLGLKDPSEDNEDDSGSGNLGGTPSGGTAGNAETQQPTGSQDAQTTPTFPKTGDPVADNTTLQKISIEKIQIWDDVMVVGMVIVGTVVLVFFVAQWMNHRKK